MERKTCNTDGCVGRGNGGQGRRGFSALEEGEGEEDLEQHRVPAGAGASERGEGWRRPLRGGESLKSTEREPEIDAL
jgi:hypothetical protein